MEDGSGSMSTALDEVIEAPVAPRLVLHAIMAEPTRISPTQNADLEGNYEPFGLNLRQVLTLTGVGLCLTACIGIDSTHDASVIFIIVCACAWLLQRGDYLRRLWLAIEKVNLSL